MLTEGQDKIKETLSISDKISDILSEEADAGSQHVIDSWLAQNEQNKALFNKICSDNTIRKKIYNYKNSDAEQAFNNFLKARKQRSNRRIYYRFLSGAAVIAICFGFLGPDPNTGTGNAKSASYRNRAAAFGHACQQAGVDIGRRHTDKRLGKQPLFQRDRKRAKNHVG